MTGTRDPERRALDLPLPLDGRPHRVLMGTRPIDPAGLFLVDRLRGDELRVKERLLREHHDEVFAALPGAARASADVLAVVVEAMTAGATPLIEVAANGALTDPQTGIVVDPASQHPIEAASRLVQEDLCLMERADGESEWRLTAASVCFPSRWLLADKIGQTMASIHEPVPDYGRIRTAADLSLDRLTPERPLTRANWTLLDDPALFQPRPAARGKAGDGLAASDRPNVLAGVHLRVERQTLSVLEPSGGVLFTIRTSVDPLTALSPDERDLLLATLRTVDPATAEYKGWRTLLPVVVHSLEASDVG